MEEIWKEVFVYRKSKNGAMSNFDVCNYYGAGICDRMGNNPRPCGKCEQFKY